MGNGVQEQNIDISMLFRLMQGFFDLTGVFISTKKWQEKKNNVYNHLKKGLIDVHPNSFKFFKSGTSYVRFLNNIHIY